MPQPCGPKARAAGSDPTAIASLYFANHATNPVGFGRDVAGGTARERSDVRLSPPKADVNKSPTVGDKFNIIETGPRKEGDR